MKIIWNTQCTLGKRGVVEFLFSKLAFLIFGIIMCSAFFYFLGVQNSIQNFDETLRRVEAINNVAGTVYASPFNTEIVYELKEGSRISSLNNSFVLSDKNAEINYPFYFEIEDSAKTENACFKIVRQDNKVVILECH